MILCLFFRAIPSREVVITLVNILIAANCTSDQELDRVIACCMFIPLRVCLHLYLFSSGLPGELRGGRAEGGTLQSHHVSLLAHLSDSGSLNHRLSWKGSVRGTEQGSCVINKELEHNYSKSWSTEFSSRAITNAQEMIDFFLDFF